MISKFPPIQGGISAKTYWMAQGLAEKGVMVHVVTNANCVEEEYRIDDQSPVLPANLTVHNIDPDIPWHIPSSDLYVPRLLDKALEIAGNNHIDIIDTNYLIPYGIVGYLLSRITGIPYIIRHGGSDIAKFLEQGVFKYLLPEVIRNASAIFTDDKNRKYFKDINSDIFTLPRYVPDERYFKPAAGSRRMPTFAYIGKVNYYWKYKSLDKIVDIFAGIEARHSLRFVGQGKGFAEFSRFAEARGLKTHEFRKFVHPAIVPQLLDRIDYLLCFSQDNPIKDFSNIMCEALWSGVTIITDETSGIHDYAKYTRGLPENQVIKLDTQDLTETQDKIKGLIHRWHGPERFNIEVEYGFIRYIEDNLKAYQDVLASIVG
ncbi:MAG: glycosyltransferase [Pseudomonadota bacterium]|nr:hypothetical protein [Candidatus Aminicenantes bacterium]